MFTLHMIGAILSITGWIYMTAYSSPFHLEPLSIAFTLIGVILHISLANTCVNFYFNPAFPLKKYQRTYPIISLISAPITAYMFYTTIHLEHFNFLFILSWLAMGLSIIIFSIEMRTRIIIHLEIKKRNSPQNDGHSRPLGKISEQKYPKHH